MNIYVGNLPYDFTDEELRLAFEEYGAVATATVIKDKISGASRGFGFVEMPDRSEAEKAVAAVNGKAVRGRTLNVNEARPRTERPGGGGGRGGGGRDYRGGGGRRRW